MKYNEILRVALVFGFLCLLLIGLFFYGSEYKHLLQNYILLAQENPIQQLSNSKAWLCCGSARVSSRSRLYLWNRLQRSLNLFITSCGTIFYNLETISTDHRDFSQISRTRGQCEAEYTTRITFVKFRCNCSAIETNESLSSRYSSYCVIVFLILQIIKLICSVKFGQNYTIIFKKQVWRCAYTICVRKRNTTIELNSSRAGYVVGLRQITCTHN